MKKIEFYGGFHSSPAISLRVSDAAYAELAEAKKANLLGDAYQYALTSYQRRRLERHFCGIKGCACSSFYRADLRLL